MPTDLSAAMLPKSDQLNSDDLIPGPITVRLVKVDFNKGGEQPVAFYIEDVTGTPRKPWKPCKSMLRLMTDLWGTADADVWLGRHVTLYRDASVKWGGDDVGGIRVSAMSDIRGSCTVKLTITKGKKAPYRVEKLTSPSAGQSRGQTQDPRTAFLSALPQIGLAADTVTEWMASIGLTPTSADDYRAVYATLKPDGGTRRAGFEAWLAARGEGAK